MNSAFWTNTIWYILLFVSSIISMISALVKSKKRKFTIAFTLAVLGYTYLTESVLLILLDSYSYSPKLINDQFQDSIWGNIFSQVSISSTSALAITFELKYRWYFIFAGIYYVIEELFVKLGIYHHTWYKSIYTLIGFAPYFWIIKKWYDKLVSSRRHFIYYITLFLGTFAAAANTLMMPLRLLNIQILKVNFYNDLSKNHTAGFIIYRVILITVLINLYRWKMHRALKGLVFAFLFAVQYALYKSGILFIKDGWFFTVTCIDIIGTYLWLLILDYMLKSHRRGENICNF